MIKQNIKEKNCGQCCLATILNISLEEAIKLVGHNKGTKSKELTRHFNSSKNYRGFPNVDALCITRHKDKKKGNWHRILRLGEEIYDPIVGEKLPIDLYFDTLPHLVVTSHFRILS